jgi:hypothetical protein
VSLQDAVNAAKAAGFTGVHLVEAVAIAQAESSGVVNSTNHNTNGTTDAGLWQVNSGSHPEYDQNRLKTDPTYAAQAAYAISKGGTDWSQWTTLHNGSAQAALPAAEAAVAQNDPALKANISNAGFWTDLGGGVENYFLGGGGIPGIGGAIGGAIGGGQIPGVGSLTSGLSGLGSLIGNLTSGAFWLRIGEGAAAVGLVIVGLMLIFRKDVTAVVETVGSKVPV